MADTVGSRVTRARRIAFEVLRQVEAEGAYAADVLHALLSAPVEREDAALATELTLGVLRWRRLLDFLLERQLEKPIERLDLEVLLALRLGLYQLRFLTRVPAHAAVSESVELTRWARKSSAAGLVNSVLRKAVPLAREPIEQLLPAEMPPAERLGILYSHPTWMVARWLEQVGEARGVALLDADSLPPRLTCILHGRAPREKVVAVLELAGIRVAPAGWLREALALRGGDPAKTEAFRRGWISVQDEASQMVALLVGVEPGHSVLDLCAAPGGKTAILAGAAGAGAFLVAADRHLHRLRAMKGFLRRVGATNARPVALDATAPLPFAARFDRILVDAPCSGTGTLARNPEIRWRLRPDDLAEFHRRQVRLLGHAIEHLAPGGRLVYSTCSLEPEENEQVVEEIIGHRSDIRCVAAADTLAPHLSGEAPVQALFDNEGYFRTLPSEHHTDGFFAAVLERTR